MRTDELRALDPARPGLTNVGGHVDRELLRLARHRVEQEEPAALLVDDLAAARGSGHHRKVGVIGYPGDCLRAPVVLVDVELTLTVGAEPDLVGVEPHAVHIVRIALGLGHLFDVPTIGVDEPELGYAPAPVSLPLFEGAADRIVCQRTSVG
jgi:hypothetical protein